MTLSNEPPWELLKVDRGRAVDFFGAFSRFEYALKAAGYVDVRKKDGAVTASWHRFAKKHAGAFDQRATPALAEAVTYLLGSPPKKQVFEDGHLSFVDAEADGNDLHKLLIYVGRVRNNLFHGGKFGPKEEEGRDEKLVRFALEVLSACVVLNEELGWHYHA